jgi:hypothetical protein
MKIAIVHDWLTVYAGAERVLEQMLQVGIIRDTSHIS